MDSWQKRLLPKDPDSISAKSTASASPPGTVSDRSLIDGGLRMLAHLVPPVHVPSTSRMNMYAVVKVVALRPGT